MYNQRDNNKKFDAFFKHRQQLIFLYNKGDMNKEEYITENFHYIMSMDTKPFNRIDHIKKGIFNYQYYNSLAKYYRMVAYDYPPTSPKRGEYLDRTNIYYEKKDRTTKKLLAFLDYQGVTGYYVQVKNPNFKGKLIEIIVDDYPDFILHTKDNLIKKQLEENFAFDSKKRKSLIDQYINEKY